MADTGLTSVFFFRKFKLTMGLWKNMSFLPSCIMRKFAYFFLELEAVGKKHLIYRQRNFKSKKKFSKDYTDLIMTSRRKWLTGTSLRFILSSLLINILNFHPLYEEGKLINIWRITLICRVFQKCVSGLYTGC